MNISINTVNDDILMAELEGALDGKTAPEVQNKILPATLNHKKVILDMSKVEYLSSAGLRILLLIYRQIKSHDGKVVIVGLSETIKDVMSNTGFIGFFTVTDTVEKGLASF